MRSSLLKSIASSVKSLSPDKFSWTGWTTAGLNPLLVASPRGSNAIPFARVEQDGWTDFFLGQQALESSHRRSILDGSSRVALHYDLAEGYELFEAMRPSTEIPARLWTSFKQDLKAEFL